MKLHRKQTIDLIRLIAGKENKKIQIRQEKEYGLNILQINIPFENLSNNTKIKKSLYGNIRKYDAQNAVVVAAPSVAAYFGLAEIMFDVRKQEMLSHIDFIFGKMPGNHILIMLDEPSLEHFTRREMSELLMTAKDCYREISIYGRETKMLKDLIELMYEEWGVVVNVPDEKKLKEVHFDSALFFAACGNLPDFSKLHFDMGYVVMDPVTEQAVCYRRREISDNRRKHGILYAGLKYEMEGNELPYEIASNIAYQKPELYREIDISFVDIYELQCYNRR